MKWLLVIWIASTVGAGRAVEGDRYPTRPACEAEGRRTVAAGQVLSGGVPVPGVMSYVCAPVAK